MDNEINTHPEYPGLINDAIQFLETMNRVYGTNRAHELWLGMKEAMGRDIQMDVFNAMLKGDSGGRIRFRVYNRDTREVVNTIKAIREFTGVGLKEAKDCWDMAKDTGRWTNLEHGKEYQSPTESRSQFRNRILRRLRELGHEAE